MSGRAGLITHHSDIWRAEPAAPCVKEDFQTSRKTPSPIPNTRLSGVTELSLTCFDVRPPGEPGTWRRRWRVARWDKSRFNSRWIRKLTSLDRVRTLLTPLLQLRRPHRTVLVAVRRSSAQSVREEGEENAGQRESSRGRITPPSPPPLLYSSIFSSLHSSASVLFFSSFFPFSHLSERFYSLLLCVKKNSEFSSRFCFWSKTIKGSQSTLSVTSPVALNKHIYLSETTESSWSSLAALMRCRLSCFLFADYTATYCFSAFTSCSSCKSKIWSTKSNHFKYEARWL